MADYMSTRTCPGDRRGERERGQERGVRKGFSIYLNNECLLLLDRPTGHEVSRQVLFVSVTRAFGTNDRLCVTVVRDSNSEDGKGIRQNVK